MVVVEPVVHDFGINPEGERASVNQRLVVLRPVGDGVKRGAHDADLKRMVVIRSPSPQLVPFKLHRFGQQRPVTLAMMKFSFWDRFLIKNLIKKTRKKDKNKTTTLKNRDTRHTKFFFIFTAPIGSDKRILPRNVSMVLIRKFKHAKCKTIHQQISQGILSTSKH